jgi:hypothetical protein
VVAEILYVKFPTVRTPVLREFVAGEPVEFIIASADAV